MQCVQQRLLRCGSRPAGPMHQLSPDYYVLRPYVQDAKQGLTLPFTACRARLPHLDEEIEHMQWQLDRRAHEEQRRERYGKQRSRGHKSGSSSRRQIAAKQKQHVFRDKPDSRSNASFSHHRHQGTGDVEVHMTAATSPSASMSAETLDHSLLLQEQTTEEEAAAAARFCLAAAASRHFQQQLHQRHSGLTATQLLEVQQHQQQLYYHLQLQNSTDLPKARDRIVRHLEQDGGCYISAEATESSVVSHLLLLLQQQQQHDSQSMLLMQPVDCIGSGSGPGQGYISTTTAAAGSHGSSCSSSSSSSTTVVQIDHCGQQQMGVCSSEAPIKLWVTAVPITAILGLQVQPPEAAYSGIITAASAGADLGREGRSNHGCRGRSSLGSDSITTDSSLSWSMQSSSDEMSASSPLGTVISPSTSSSRPVVSHSETLSRYGNTAAGGHTSRSQGRADAALITAARRSSSATAAFIQHSACIGGLKHIKVGTHADIDAVAMGLVEAAAAGLLVSLHVKGHAIAHRAAYAAVAAAAALLSTHASSKGLGMMLVPGKLHEHVHAVTHGHPAAEGVTAYAHAGSHAARVASDASMSVGGFGAAFYGVGGEIGGVEEHGGLQHIHAQEVWLCVVPFGSG